VVADEAGDVLDEGGFVEAGAEQLDCGGAPQGPHPGPAPDRLALGVGLQDGQRQDAPGAQVGVELGQVGDAAHVGGLVQDGEQRRPSRPPRSSAALTAQRSTRSVRAATSGAAEPPPSLDSRYSVWWEQAKAAGSNRFSPGAGAVQAVICGSRRHRTAVRAVNSTDPRVSAGACMLARSERASAG